MGEFWVALTLGENETQFFVLVLWLHGDHRE